MQLSSQKCVLITGASSGIGRACAVAFAQAGAKRLILSARRAAALSALSDELSKTYGATCFILPLDVQDHAAVKHALTHLPQDWQSIDILINNAGLALGLDKVQGGDVAQWDQMIDTNIKGLLYVTRYVLPGMVSRRAGHIINIGSISAHQVYPAGSVYCATKFAVRALSEGIKMDVHGTPIRVSSVDPGMVDTAFSTVRFSGDEQKAAAVYRGMTPLAPEDIADAVLYCATRPAHVNVREIKLYPTDQTAALMCHRAEEESV